VRREAKTGFIYFIQNGGEKDFEGWLPVQTNSSTVAIFNPMTEVFGMAKSRTAIGGATEIYTRLAKDEALIIETFNDPLTAKQYSFYDQASSPVELSGKWKLSFVDGGPALPASREIDKLTSWTNTGGDEVKNYSGSGLYQITFKKPSGKADAWMLNLGKVCESAKVLLNGKEIATLIGPDFKVTIDGKLLKSSNLLEIRVSNLMANRIAYMDRNNIEWKKFYNVNFNARIQQNTKNRIFDASAWEPRESGLIGPVTLTGMKLVK
jgi:hypothetical protein